MLEPKGTYLAQDRELLVAALNPEVHDQIGIAVPAALRANWTYIAGSSRRRNLFIHDSHHSSDNMLFELRQAWPALRPGGAAIVDDIDASEAFHSFRETTHHDRAWICEAEPVRPDDRRANGKGFFGIILKPA